MDYAVNDYVEALLADPDRALSRILHDLRGKAAVVKVNAQYIDDLLASETDPAVINDVRAALRDVLENIEAVIEHLDNASEYNTIIKNRS